MMMIGLARIGVVALTALLALPAWAAGERIGEVSTSWRLVGPNDKVAVEVFDDPGVANAACFISYADVGGITGGLGLRENPSRFSVACRGTGAGPVCPIKKLRTDLKGEEIWEKDASFFFKEFRITRFIDPKRNVAVYLLWSTKLIDGSPFNSISAVALDRNCPEVKR